jgi:NAD(P)-dependent dehydrogenase (short-subunit alcohol dehydrogenase family)
LSEPLELSGKVAVVTGASRGIGSAIASRFAAAGAAVVVHYREREAEAHGLATKLEENGARVVAIGADLREPDQVERLFRDAANELGEVDVLVNNAGTYPLARLVDASPRTGRRSSRPTSFRCTSRPRPPPDVSSREELRAPS